MHTENGNHEKGINMKQAIQFAIISTLLIGIVGCASDPNIGGEVVSGVLMGIGTGLSGL